MKIVSEIHHSFLARRDEPGVVQQSKVETVGFTSNQMTFEKRLVRIVGTHEHHIDEWFGFYRYHPSSDDGVPMDQFVAVETKVPGCALHQRNVESAVLPTVTCPATKLPKQEEHGALA